ncbi:hypothetical protein AN958_05151 [Leucoagaricus sp. SymC.cos]|nr:hypothetical protein AN958_05151 [Leucoagaricus sp. SymC.cos]
MIAPFPSNAHSIQRLSIHVTRTSQLRQFFTSKASFTNLESLSLVIKHVDIDAATPITVFCDSPCLSRVALDLNGCPLSPSFIRLPWDMIEDFVMTGTSLLPADDFQSILASSPNLRKASFWVQDAHVLHHSSSLPTSGCGTGASTHASTTSITLPQLTDLSMSFHGHHEKTASSLLISFSLPHLRHFHFFSGVITLSSAAIVASSNRLETFVVSGVDISAAEFRSFATQNPSLHSLTLDLRYCRDDDISGVLDVLAAEQPRVLPLLSDLSLWTHNVSPHSATYLRLIRSRGQNASNKLCLLLNLAHQQYGSCCHFSTCTNEQSSAGETIR